MPHQPRFMNEVVDSMLPFFKEQYGNPSSIHRYGRLARKAIEKSRKQIAQLINADPSEILSLLVELNQIILYYNGSFKIIHGPKSLHLQLNMMQF